MTVGSSPKKLICPFAGPESNSPVLPTTAAVFFTIPMVPAVFGPMSYAVMGGLAVATSLTLLFLPALRVTWFGIARRQTSEITSLQHSGAVAAA